MADVPIPSMGRIVYYKLSEADADEIYQRRVAKGFKGNTTAHGQVFAAMVVNTAGTSPDSSVNLQVFLDGDDSFWAQSRKVARGRDDEGYFTWPVRTQ